MIEGLRVFEFLQLRESGIRVDGFLLQRLKLLFQLAELLLELGLVIACACAFTNSWDLLEGLGRLDRISSSTGSRVFASSDSQSELVLVLPVNIGPSPNQLLHQLATVHGRRVKTRGGRRQLDQELIRCDCIIFILTSEHRPRETR